MSLWTRFAVVTLAAVLFAGPAIADDWVADKLRGKVLQLVDGQWQPLARGDVVPDSRPVRTLATGYVSFTRGGETVELGPRTQVQIYDRAGSKPFTTVKQYFGSVSVEAEVQNVQHFAVQTPYLAAVVKGTRFTVTSGKSSASVSVRRGHVAVEDKQNDTHVTLSVGQSAKVDTDKGGALEVTGHGTLPPVLDAKGRPVDPAGALSALRAAARQAAEQAKLLKTPEARAAAEAARKALQAAEKYAKEAAKEAEKAEKDAEKAAEKAAKQESSGSPGGSNSSGPSGSSDSSGSGNSGSSDKSGPGNSDSGHGKGKD